MADEKRTEKATLRSDLSFDSLDLEPESSIHETRESTNREALARPMPWEPARLMPAPDPRPGYDFRYVRAEYREKADTINVSQAKRDGWVPVKASDYPELCIDPDPDSRYPENVFVGGLLLCIRPKEIGDRIKALASEEIGRQMEGVDRSFFREQQASMPLLTPERSTRTTFGGN